LAGTGRAVVVGHHQGDGRRAEPIRPGGHLRGRDCIADIRIV
jgi:hypothetical protein